MLLRFFILMVCIALHFPAGAAEKVDILTARGEVVLNKYPERIAVFDWAALDTLHRLGVPVGATTARMQVDYLMPLFAQAATVGTVFDPDYEALNAYAPDLVITGGPGAHAYAQLAALAPTIDMTIANDAIRESGKARIDAFATLFGKEAQGEFFKQAIDDAFARARAAARGKGKVLVLSVTGNKIAAFGVHSRLASWLHTDLGIPPADEHLVDSPHGQPVSFEYVRSVNPDWIFVLDRTSSLGEPGKSAYEVLDNPLVQETTAWRQQRIITFPNANYIAAGGITQLLQAAEQVEQAFNADAGKTHE